VTRIQIIISSAGIKGICSGSRQVGISVAFGGLPDESGFRPPIRIGGLNNPDRSGCAPTKRDEARRDAIPPYETSPAWGGLRNSGRTPSAPTPDYSACTEVYPPQTGPPYPWLPWRAGDCLDLAAALARFFYLRKFKPCNRMCPGR